MIIYVFKIKQMTHYIKCYGIIKSQKSKFVSLLLGSVGIPNLPCTKRKLFSEKKRFLFSFKCLFSVY